MPSEYRASVVGVISPTCTDAVTAAAVNRKDRCTYIYLTLLLSCLTLFCTFTPFMSEFLILQKKALNCCLISNVREKLSHSDKRDECNNLGKAGNKTAATDPQKYVSAWKNNSRHDITYMHTFKNRCFSLGPALNKYFLILCLFSLP